MREFGILSLSVRRAGDLQGAAKKVAPEEEGPAMQMNRHKRRRVFSFIGEDIVSNDRGIAI